MQLEVSVTDVSKNYTIKAYGGMNVKVHAFHISNIKSSLCLNKYHAMKTYPLLN